MRRIIWILTANASLARIFEHRGGRNALTLVRELSHPESREKAADLVTDRPGRARGYGDGQWALDDSDPKRDAHEDFALEIAREVERAITARSFDRLIISASPAFLGLLKRRLDERVTARIMHSLDKDYTAANERELLQILADYIAF